MKRLLVTVAICVCLAGPARADLAGRIDSIINQPGQKKVQFGIHIVDANSGITVYGHNANQAMIPASNMKVITTAAALKYLGPNYQYKTVVWLCDDTLVITGSGDPLLGDKTTDAKYGRADGWIFEDIVSRLKQNDIKTIKDIIVDTSIFDDQRVHQNWPAEELNKWYACEVSGLNFTDNCIDVTTRTVGGKVAVLIEPQTNYVEIINKVVPVSNGNTAVGAYRQLEPNKIVVRGKCKGEIEPFPVAIEKPASFFAFLLAENLRKAGINVEGQMVEKTASRESNLKKLAEYTTPITDCLGRCNKNSLGLAAEALLKTIAANSNPERKNGSWPVGRELISQYLLGLGIRSNEFYIDDGSGLSRQNKLSANAITKVLLNVYKSGNWGLYKDSLAVGGVDGTIRRYFKEERYQGKILGKTGYITGVKSFSGVCGTTRGDYIFSILTNKANDQTRDVINDVAEAIVDE